MVSARKPFRRTPETEKRMIAAAQEGDAIAREQLVEAFMPLVAGIARYYRGTPGIEWAELKQEGVVGLLRALERFDIELGTPFWGYASWWVRQAMQNLVAQMSHPVVLSDRALRQLARVKAARARLGQAHGTEPGTAELAAATALRRDQVDALFAVDRRPFSLDEPLGADHDGSQTLADLLADARSEDAFEGVTRRCEIAEVRALRAALSGREREVLRARFGFGAEQATLKEIGARLGVSAERVRQIEKRALERLRAEAMAPRSAALPA